MKGEIELYNKSFLILKVELHFKISICYILHLSGFKYLKCQLSPITLIGRHR